MDKKDNQELDNRIHVIEKMLKANKAKALGVATIFSLSSILGGCAAKSESYLTPDRYQGESESSSSAGTYYGTSHGGSYYFYRGALNAASGSWGKNNRAFKSANAADSFYNAKSGLKSSGIGNSSFKSGKSGTIGKSSYKSSHSSSGKSGGVSG